MVSNFTLSLYNRCITGEARASLKPTASQKWHKNRQAGGGAILPCSWILRVPRDMMDRVVEVVKARLPDVEGHEIMEVKVCTLYNIIPYPNEISKWY